MDIKIEVGGRVAPEHQPSSFVTPYSAAPSIFSADYSIDIWQLTLFVASANAPSFHFFVNCPTPRYSLIGDHILLIIIIFCCWVESPKAQP